MHRRLGQAHHINQGQRDAKALIALGLFGAHAHNHAGAAGLQSGHHRARRGTAVQGNNGASQAPDRDGKSKIGRAYRQKGGQSIAFAKARFGQSVSEAVDDL